MCVTPKTKMENMVFCEEEFVGGNLVHSSENQQTKQQQQQIFVHRLTTDHRCDAGSGQPVFLS